MHFLDRCKLFECKHSAEKKEKKCRTLQNIDEKQIINNMSDLNAEMKNNKICIELSYCIKMGMYSIATVNGDVSLKTRYFTKQN